MEVCSVILGLAFGVVILLLLLLNSFVKSHNRVKEAYKAMEIQFKKRWDLIPKLVEIVKKYIEYESETLEGIVKEHGGDYDSLSNDEKIITNEKITKVLNRIMLLSKNHPDLTEDETFDTLTKELVKIEDEINETRTNYNASVHSFNTKVESFPRSVFAKLFGYKTKPLFETNDNVRIELKIS